MSGGPQSSPLRWTRLVAQAHRYLAEVLGPGELAVDLTAGNGQDTLFLWQAVAPGGRVAAFDIQQDALARTARLVGEAGAAVFAAGRLGSEPGLYLFADDHSRIELLIAEAPRAVIANLGFLPGGDPRLTTRSSSTRQALSHALRMLAAGGRIAVAAYTGHAGGEEETLEVAEIFSALPARWQALTMEVPNRSRSPRLFLAEKPGGDRARS